ncbi:MAG: MotE family protein [Shimia sp.]|uniref:MotE family protein n=1 Tax=Shimia sp. TaxID=1954381 RepID=UPI004058587D
MVTSFLVASALLRVGVGASEAIAREEPLIGSPLATMSSPQTCEQPEDMRALMAAFEEREMRIEKQEEEIRNRMQALAVADTEVTRKLAELEAAEGRLRSVIAVAETAADDDVTRLTRVYETMKPKNVAALFEEMDPDFAAGFIARMNPDSAAGVMAGLSPHAAYTISVVLAGRNANVPTD